ATAEKTTRTPVARTTAPIQSHAVQAERQRLPLSVVRKKKNAPRQSATAITASSARTRGAMSVTTTAPAIHHRVRVAMALAQSQKQSAAHGYASGSPRI